MRRIPLSLILIGITGIMIALLLPAVLCDVVLGAAEINQGFYSGPPDNCPKGPTNPYSFTSGSITNACDMFHYWSFHPNGANFLRGDASVRFMPYSAANIMVAFATRDKGETFSEP